MLRKRQQSHTEAPATKDFPLAFVILAHNEWSTLTELVTVLSAAPEDTVVVHVDRKVDQRRVKAFEDHFRNRPNVLVFSEVRCKWGGISLVDVTLRALEKLTRTGRPYSYVSLLSGVDYPIKPLAEFRYYLKASHGNEFIEAYSFYTQRWIKTGIYAERFEYVFPFARSGLLTYPFLLWYKLVELIDLRRPMPKGFVPYSGSQWWTLTRGFIDWLQTSSESRELLQRMRATFVPDEMYFQTLVMSSPFSDRVKFRNLRHIEWLGSGTPYTFKSGDFNRLARSPQFFCRKIVKRYDIGFFRRINDDLVSGRRPRRRPKMARPSAQPVLQVAATGPVGIARADAASPLGRFRIRRLVRRTRVGVPIQAARVQDALPRAIDPAE